MLRLDKVIRPWKESAALNDHINLYGFWNETTFLTKSGDLGIVLSISGVDYESLDRSEQEYAVKGWKQRSKRLAQASTFINTSSNRIAQTYHSRAMTTRSWRQLSTNGGSSLKPSETIFTKLRSSTASFSKALGRRPASEQLWPASYTIQRARLANSKHSSPTTA